MALYVLLLQNVPHYFTNLTKFNSHNQFSHNCSYALAKVLGGALRSTFHTIGTCGRCGQYKDSMKSKQGDCLMLYVQYNKCIYNQNFMLCSAVLFLMWFRVAMATLVFRYVSMMQRMVQCLCLSSSTTVAWGNDRSSYSNTSWPYLYCHIITQNKTTTKYYDKVNEIDHLHLFACLQFLVSVFLFYSLSLSLSNKVQVETPAQVVASTKQAERRYWIETRGKKSQTSWGNLR